MPMIPWAQQTRGARFGEEPPTEPPKPPGAPPKPPEIVGEKPKEKSWWEQKMGPEGWTWPWEAEHWKRPGAEAAKWGLGVAGLAGGALLGGYALPAAASWLSGAAPWLTQAALPLVSHPTLAGIAGGSLGWMGSQAIPPYEPGQPAPGAPGLQPPAAPPGAPEPTAPPVLPMPGEGGEAAQPTFFTDEQGQRWVYNEYTGAWTVVRPPGAPPTTPEQQATLTAEERAYQEEMLRLQYQLEQQSMVQQQGASRGQQEAAAAQQMAQMYAADPYKYWAQLKQGTPEAVARLTGGEVAPGEKFQQGVPLSTPSAQWWGNLLPSEQQQISGGLNWMGIDPADWYSMYQQMIPGLGSRQPGPVWAR